MVQINEKTRLNLRVDNVWSIIASIVISAFIFGAWTTKIDSKQELILLGQKQMSKELADIKSSFKEIHKDTVQNHDDIIKLKSLVGLGN